MGELGYTERHERTPLKRTNENKNHVLRYQRCRAAGDNARPLGDFRGLAARARRSLMEVHASKAVVCTWYDGANAA